MSFNFIEAETNERIAHGLALRIEHAGFQRDVDFGFHRFAYSSGRSWEKDNISAPPASLMIPRRRATSA